MNNNARVDLFINTAYPLPVILRSSQTTQPGLILWTGLACAYEIGASHAVSAGLILAYGCGFCAAAGCCAGVGAAGSVLLVGCGSGTTAA